MNENITKLQAVMNTLEGLEIQAKKDTMMKLLGCLQFLGEVRDSLSGAAEVETDGNDHAE